ncbi:PilZ domain-containing protein [Catenovulum sp. SM1970]|uniref:PilZ domain-containing protein n=1 Tax=Marinifaba aquimaris TaxID=2741323 RepID=UPI0015716E13|nr:PilZ domain-containing protein [Marinifaba aquimaris]NTS77966.1 PilZ domain-containing protein [Marinifaba aquimaris]
MEEIPLEFRSVHELYKHFMPFIQQGGLFFETNRLYDMGHPLALSVLLPGSLEPISVSGKIVWVTPIGSQGATPQGVGIGFIDDKDHLKDRIETMLGTMLNSNEPTYTM